MQSMQAAEVDRLGGTERQHSNHSQAIPSVKFSPSLLCFSVCLCMCVPVSTDHSHKLSNSLGPLGTQVSTCGALTADTYSVFSHVLITPGQHSSSNIVTDPKGPNYVFA